MQRTWVAIRRSNAPRYDTGGYDTRGSKRDMARSARATRARVEIQILYRDRKGPVTRLRHGRAQAVIRPGEGHDTTPGALRQGRPSAQPGPWVCAHCALDPVLNQDTVLSHCS